MRVDVLYLNHLAGEHDLRGRTAIAVDVLRATTTVVAAFDAGCTQCHPAASPENARALGRQLGELALLGGESNARRLEGFDLGNSPLEYTPARVAGRALVLATSNGTAAIRRTAAGRVALVASLRNARAAATRVWALQHDLTVLCAGAAGQFCLEDTVGAGLIVHHLAELAGGTLVLNDLAAAARDLARHHRSGLPQLLRHSTDGRYLAGLGHEQDLDFCGQADVSAQVPVFSGGVIRPGPA
jgi:2-phosphosulfolactate phosphatase